MACISLVLGGVRPTSPEINTKTTQVATEGGKIMVDIGLVIAIEERWGGGEIIACEDGGRICNVGVEDLRGVSEFDPSVVTDRFTNMDRPLREAEAIYGANSAEYKGFLVRSRRCLLD